MQSVNVLAETQFAAADSQALDAGATQLPADPFVVADQAATGAIVDAILAATPGLTVDYNSVVVIGGPSSVGYYDGSLSPLGIGAGLLITSGTMPGTSNTVGWFGVDNGMNGDPALDAVINPIFATQSYDATSISFDFTVTDPSITGISFNIVFGTDEYPEWVDQFVDIAVVLVNGVNVAYFGNDPNAPLSVISQNLAAGYFLDNGTGNLPIEYDGVSNVLTVFAPVHLGVNSITIAIADTGDHIYDSGLFISGLTGVSLPATGVSQDVPCTEGDDDFVGGNSSESFNGLGGDDSLNGGGGDDVVQGGAGSDHIMGGSGHDVLIGGLGNDVMQGGAGIDTLLGGLGLDKLYGDAGNDTLTGNGGADQFIWSANANLGSDHITDFENGVDHIRLAGTGATQFSDLAISTNGSGWAVITLANGTEITLDGVLASAVDASDFLWI